jgi:Porin-like glycoporin RafY
MNQSIKFAIRATAIASALVSGAAFAAPEIDANIELNNMYKSGSAFGQSTVANYTNNDKGLSQAGRVEVNMASKSGADSFVAGRASLIAGKNGTASIDDMWVQLGNKTVDAKLGRFEAADLFPTPGDVALTTLGSDGTNSIGYRANVLRGRKGSDSFHAAGTANLGSLSLEVGVIDETKTTLTAGTYKGIRPVLSYAAGQLSAKLGLESGENAAGSKLDGMGLTVGYNFGAAAVNMNYASGKQADVRGTSFGLMGTMGAFTLGFISAKTDVAGVDPTENTIYAAYAIPLMGVKGATVTPAFSTSTVKSNTVASHTVDAVNVRLNYAF